MTEVTPKRSLDAWRGYEIHTRSWKSIVEFYQDLIAKGLKIEPMLNLVKALANSSVNSELFAGTSHSNLLLSNVADFRIGDSTIVISYRPSEREFDFKHLHLSEQNDEKTCSEAEGLSTLRLFIRYKFGILFEVSNSSKN
jgi:hypothetical protein